MEHFDVIIIGAGPAGSVAGYLLAKAGLNVILIERGQAPGCKNVSGGLLYTKPVKKLLAGFSGDMPVERAITSHKVVMLGEGASVSLDYHSGADSPSEYNAYSVLRAKFDPWLAQQAEAAGAALITGVTVDELLVEDGRVTGIKAGEDALSADVVVIAEGTRSMLLKQAGLRGDYNARDVSLGIKEVIALQENTLQERFQCGPGTGAAYTFAGHTAGVEGGGFLYTNSDSISLGVVVKIDSLAKSGLQPHQVLDAFKAHPLVRRLVEGGEVVEYSAQTVHRGGFHLPCQLYGDGYVTTGSAARLTLNNIFTLRGMDFAMLSAEAAAKAILSAREKGSFDAATLSTYETHLQETAIYQDWKTFKDVYPLLENERLFETYPNLACSVLESLFSPTDQPGKKIIGALQQEMQGKVSPLTLVKDGMQIGRGMVL